MVAPDTVSVLFPQVQEDPPDELRLLESPALVGQRRQRLVHLGSGRGESQRGEALDQATVTVTGGLLRSPFRNRTFPVRNVWGRFGANSIPNASEPLLNQLRIKNGKVVERIALSG
jgi:hypothetical protein